MHFFTLIHDCENPKQNRIELVTRPGLRQKETNELIVNTPTPLAQKYWITNGAIHAKHIVVFAHLHVDGVNQVWSITLLHLKISTEKTPGPWDQC